MHYEFVFSQKADCNKSSRARFSEGVQHGNAAGAEADDSSQCGDQHQSAAEVQGVGEYCGNRKQQPQDIQPERCVDRGVKISAETQLKQEGSKSDGSHDDNRQWTEECWTAGINHDHAERKQQ